MRLNQVTVSVTDIPAAVTFYTKLGLTLIVRSEHYARFICPEGESTFSVHLADTPAMASTVIYFENDQLDELVKRLKEAGLHFDTDPADQRWLWREARLRDPSGNPICLFKAGANRLYPPWRIQESLT